ncbi:hypothetical protein TKK_0007105 [Trichogramma kaykai]
MDDGQLCVCTCVQQQFRVSGSIKELECRIKQESADESFIENDEHGVISQTSGMENFQSSRFEKENSIRRLQERDQNRKIHLDDVEIEFECRDQKPVLNSLLKMEDDSQNYSQDVKYGNDWATTNGIKREIVTKVHNKIAHG